MTQTGEEKKTSWSSEEWAQLVTQFCPFTRKPCDEQINPEGGANPENIRECVFMDVQEGCYDIHDRHRCILVRAIETLSGQGELGTRIGIFLHKQTFGDLPNRDHWKDEKGRTRTGDWEWWDY